LTPKLGVRCEVSKLVEAGVAIQGLQKGSADLEKQLIEEANLKIQVMKQKHREAAENDLKILEEEIFLPK
jgi:hypothetical protein